MITFQKMLNTVLVSLFVLMVFVGCKEADPLGSITFETFEMAEGDESSLSDEERDQYREIAEKLAIRYVNEKNPEETEIPEEVVAFFYHGLIHLDNSDLDEAKTVTDEYMMTKKSPSHPREILLWVDLSEAWLDNWRNGELKTGVPEIDELIEKFDLSLYQYRELTATIDEALVEMRSNRLLNVFAVGKLFENVEEIRKAGPQQTITGGRDVEAAVKENFLLLDVTVGSGDCPAGCINRINHRFRIFSDGKVELDE